MDEEKTLYERGDCCLYYLMSSRECINQLVGPIQVRCLGYPEYCHYKIVDGNITKRDKEI